MNQNITLKSIKIDTHTKFGINKKTLIRNLKARKSYTHTDDVFKYIYRHLGETFKSKSGSETRCCS